MAGRFLSADQADTVEGSLGDGLTAAMIRRVPLAESAFWLLRVACDPERLGSLWDRFRGRGYERIITFATMVQLVSDALLCYRGSGRRTFETHIAENRLEASVAAAFGKLGRLPLPVTLAFLEETTASVRSLLVPANLTDPPASLRAFHPVVIDGKVVKRVEKRLKPTRTSSGGLIGGKSLVALDGRTGLAVAMEAHPDGDHSERNLLPGLLERVRRIIPAIRLVIADQYFGNLVQVEQFTENDDHFVLRLHTSVKFYADPKRSPQTGRDAEGRTVIETWGIAGSEGNRRRRPLRRIELIRPGEPTITLITDLEDADVYPAADLLTAYRNRHDIERVFQQTTEVFGLTRLIGTSPLAGLFQFSFCLLLYNIVQILRGGIAEAAERPAERISSEKLFDDVRDQLNAWRVMIPSDRTEAYFATLTDIPRLQRHLKTILANVWNPTWTKSPSRPQRKVEHKTTRRTHHSIQRLLDAAKPAKKQPRKNE